MSFQLDLLETLAAVVDYGSFDAAARVLRMTPSAVSQRIKSLEQQCGRVLVQRSKPAVVTESGAVMLRLARQLEMLQLDARSALDPQSKSRVTLPVVVNADSLATWILPAIAHLSDISFDLYCEDQDHSTALLRDGTVMAAVTADPTPVQGCTVARLGVMRYQAMASPAFTARWMPGGVTTDAFADAPMIVFNLRDELQDTYLAQRSRRTLTPPRHHVPASADFVQAAVLGFGWAMLPDIQTAVERADGRLMVLDAEHPVDVTLYWQQWALDTAALNSVKNAIADAARQLY